MAKEQVESFEQALTKKRNTVLELELNARYWKAQYELKHYTILENGLRAEYAAILNAKEEVMKNIDEMVTKVEQEVLDEVDQESDIQQDSPSTNL